MVTLTPAQSEMTAEMTPVRYTVLFGDVDRHQIEIVATFPTEGATSMELMIPVWTPGSYLIREYARNIEAMTIEDPSEPGKSIPFQKTHKNKWKVECSGHTLLQVRYRLYCREMGVRTNWVERDFGFITGAAAFITRSDWLDHPHEVRFELPTQWRDVATSLSQIGSSTSNRRAKDYDELVDSPVLLGQLDIHSFEAGGKKHYFVNAMADELWDGKKAVADMQRIVEHEHEFWGIVPYQSYWFLNIASESGGGLEHDNSCILMSSRWAMKKRTQYVDWLSLVSHEFFHTWNVRRLRPKTLRKYDYSNEQYFPELWIAEGITSYYDDLFVAQTHLCTPSEYLGRLSKNIATVQNAHGRTVQPLSDSSFDTWIKFYRPDENATNSRVSYYTKGALVAMLLDCEIQRKTQGAKSLRDVMQRLWKDGVEKGYSQEEFESITAAIVGEEMGSWFDRHIRETAELDFQPFLDWYGLRFKGTNPKGDESKKGEVVGAKGAEPTLEGWVGCDTALVDGKLIVKRIPRNSPADQAGLNVDDELLAIDDYRLGSDFADRLTHYQPGNHVRFLIARRGKLLSIDMTLGVKPSESWTLEIVPEPTEDQKKHWGTFLKIDSMKP